MYSSPIQLKEIEDFEKITRVGEKWGRGIDKKTALPKKKLERTSEFDSTQL